MKIQFLLFFSIVCSSVFCQVTSVDYLIKFNCETNQYDVHIVVLEGTANTIPQRAQFNSQISFVVPTGLALELVDSYMPIQNNQMYDGNEPIKWYKSTPLVAPEAQPESDFYGVTPVLAPASFYNDLEVGDEVKIFSITVGPTGEYNEKVRFFKNDEDPSGNEPGMMNYNFSNGFTIGGSAQTFNSSSEVYCTSSVDIEDVSEFNISPNPFSNQFTIELEEDIKSVQILDKSGKIHYQSEAKSSGILIINSADFPAGSYYTRIITQSGSVVSKRLIKI